MKRIRHVLHATDFSPASREAFTVAVAIAKSLGAKLTVVYVMAPLVPAVPEQYLDAVTLDQLDKRARQWCARQLRNMTASATRAGVRTKTQIRNGDPVEQIVRAGRSTRADLIVVGTHGRRGLPKFFLGSVAERVVATASCPVVTVRGR
jgi:nucleotide-binding universal stress UspA family protein